MGIRTSEILPFLAMVIVQFGYAGMNIITKVAMDSGMAPLILVSYRQIFATVTLIPFAYLVERKTRPKITKQVLFHIFLCSIFGASLNQVFFFVGLKNTTPTIPCALSNMLPAITFILAVPFGLEAVGLKSRAGQAKIMGTIICVGGAMLLSFYHGQVIVKSQLGIQWRFADHTKNGNNNNSPSPSPSSHPNFLLGILLLLASNLAMAVWFILQKKMSETFAAPYTSSALMCFMSSIQCIVVAIWSNHNILDWSLNGIRSAASIYAGVVGSALAFCLMSWTIQKKGPLYVSVFSPLLLVIVAFLSWILLSEKLYFGTVVGSTLIVVGLYAVLWGKSREMANDNNLMDERNGSYQGQELEDYEKDKEQDLRNGNHQGWELEVYEKDKEQDLRNGSHQSRKLEDYEKEQEFRSGSHQDRALEDYEKDKEQDLEKQQQHTV